MAEGVLGLVIAGGDNSPLAALGVTGSRALTPFAAQYRLLDFALATAGNSAIRQVSLASIPDVGSSRLPRVLAACQRAATAFEPHWVAVLAADHILQVDLRPALEALEEQGNDVALLALPLRPSERADHPVVDRGDGRELCWGGDFVVRADVLPRLLRAFERPGTSNGHTAATLAEHADVLVLDVSRAAATGPRFYWHEPSSLEAYYASQMELCTPEPVLDLYDPSWPIRSVTTGLPPAKVTSDAGCGHMGQAVNSLLADGCMIRGGAVIRSIVGPRCVVDAGAEVEDSILLEGCRVARGAQVRRAVIGAGVVVGEHEQVGYDEDLRPDAHRLASGLTLISGRESVATRDGGPALQAAAG